MRLRNLMIAFATLPGNSSQRESLPHAISTFDNGRNASISAFDLREVALP
jgi:hypothetical protein